MMVRDAKTVRTGGERAEKLHMEEDNFYNLEN